MLYCPNFFWNVLQVWMTGKDVYLQMTWSWPDKTWNILCSYCLQWNTSQSKCRNHYFFFYLRFPYCPNFFWFGVVLWIRFLSIKWKSMGSKTTYCVPQKKIESNRFGMTWGQANDDRIFIFGWTILLNPWFLGRKGPIVISGIEWDVLLYVFSHGSCSRLFLCFLVWRISRPMASFLVSFSDRRPPDQQKPQAYSNNSSRFKPNPSFNWCLRFWGWCATLWSLWLNRPITLAPNPLQKHFILLQDDWAEQQVLAQKRTGLSWEPRWGLGIAHVDLELRDSDPWESLSQPSAKWKAAAQCPLPLSI